MDQVSVLDRRVQGFTGSKDSKPSVVHCFRRAKQSRKSDSISTVPISEELNEFVYWWWPLCQRNLADATRHDVLLHERLTVLTSNTVHVPNCRGSTTIGFEAKRVLCNIVFLFSRSYRRRPSAVHLLGPLWPKDLQPCRIRAVGFMLPHLEPPATGEPPLHCERSGLRTRISLGTEGCAFVQPVQVLPTLAPGCQGN